MACPCWSGSLDKWRGCTEQTRTEAQAQAEEMKDYMDGYSDDDGVGCVFAARVHADNDGKSF